MRILRAHPLEVAGVVLFAVLSLVLTGLVANTLAQSSAGDRNTYVAEFTDASGISPGDEVRIAGVRVGRVESRELSDGVARVEFSVEEDQQVRTDTRAHISYLNLLGQRYLVLEAGAKPGPAMKAGDVIGTNRTAPALDLTELFNAFEPLFDALDPDDVNVLAREIVDMMQGQGPTIAHLTTQTADLTTHLADRDAIITRVIDNVTVVMTSMSEHRGEIADIIAGLNRLVGGLADDSGDIDAALTSMDRLTTSVDGLLDESAEPLTSSVSSMNSVGGTMVDELENFRTATNKLPVMLDAYARSMSYGSWLNIHICSLSIGLPGDRTLLTGDVGPTSEACK
jgi:phospholipid/cholesterol/gamma-HCH transport system substrate-binding protein